VAILVLVLGFLWLGLLCPKSRIFLFAIACGIFITSSTAFINGRFYPPGLIHYLSGGEYGWPFLWRAIVYVGFPGGCCSTIVGGFLPMSFLTDVAFWSLIVLPLATIILSYKRQVTPSVSVKSRYGMSTKNLLLGIFVLLILVFASLTLSEYSEVNTLNSQLQSQSKSASTVTLTFETTITSTITSPSTTTVTSTVTGPSNMTYGSFTYAPTGQVQVDSVMAFASQARNGRLNITFAVKFENIGNSPVRAIGGWVGALSSDVPANSSVLQEAPSQRCAGAIYIVTVNHEQNYTVYAPDCGTGFNYQLVNPGSVDVLLSFNWTTNLKENTPFSNTTTISARFSFA
jgi:hypothetical protein